MNGSFFSSDETRSYLLLEVKMELMGLNCEDVSTAFLPSYIIQNNILCMVWYILLGERGGGI